jgi:hypothetical protein
MADPPAVLIEGSDARRLPSGPLLQPSPEVELEAMNEEMSARVQGFGWSDESSGVAYVPIEEGIDRVLEIGVGKTAEMPPPPDTETAVGAAAGAAATEGGTP